MAASRSIFPANTYGFLKWYTVTDATESDLPIDTDDVPEFGVSGVLQLEGEDIELGGQKLFI